MHEGNDRVLGMTPMQTGLRQHGAASAWLREFEPLPDSQLRQIVRLHTDEGARRQGDAGRLLRDLCIEADIAATVLVIEPKAYADAPLDDDALAAWYRRYGFKAIQSDPITLMARSPRAAANGTH